MTTRRPRQTQQVVFSIAHLLLLAVSTYVATFYIKTILTSGFICSISGLALGVVALRRHRRALAAIALLTPVTAVVLFLLEAIVLHLGPRNAALPFAIVFLINQTITTLVILVELQFSLSNSDRLLRQVTLRTLLVSMTSFCLFFTLARYLLEWQHNWRMGIALGLLGLTIVGIVSVLFANFTATPDRQTALPTEDVEG